MMPQKTFERVAFALATLQFNEWSKELGNRVDAAMNTALYSDNRLSDKTRKKIFDKFVSEVKAGARASN